jgi:hypothetical protein
MSVNQVALLEVSEFDGEELATLRVHAMRESLEQGKRPAKSSPRAELLSQG